MYMYIHIHTYASFRCAHYIIAFFTSFSLTLSSSNSCSSLLTSSCSRTSAHINQEKLTTPTPSPSCTYMYNAIHMSFPTPYFYLLTITFPCISSFFFLNSSADCWPLIESSSSIPFLFSANCMWEGGREKGSEGGREGGKEEGGREGREGINNTG